MLEINKLDYCYKNFHALKNIDLNFSKPQLVGPLGHNGSGKSTLLKILGASLACNRGQIKLFGNNALDNFGYIIPSLRKHVGIVFQTTSSDLALSAYDNFLYFARLMSIPASEHARLIHEFLRLANLSERAFEPLKKLSHGMRRRLELYRAFMHKPRIVLLDEPTDGLDFYETARFWEFVKNYCKEEEALIVLATHRSFELEYCDDIVMLHKGIKIAHSRPQKLLSALNFVHVEVTLRECPKEAWQGPPNIKFSASSESPRIMRAQVAKDLLEEVLTSAMLRSSLVQSVRFARPQLEDAYEIRIGELERYVN